MKCFTLDCRYKAVKSEPLGEVHLRRPRLVMSDLPHAVDEAQRHWQGSGPVCQSRAVWADKCSHFDAESEESSR